MLSLPALVESRDDLLLERITLLNELGRNEEAKDQIDSHRFHPWEGGEGKVPAQYQAARVALAGKAMEEKRWKDAVRWLEECLVYPQNLGEGKLSGAQEQDFYWYLGCAWNGAGDNDKARECWEKAASGKLKPASALYYNDANPEKIYYQGLALNALGRVNKAREKFQSLFDFASQHIDDEVTMDYFAVSLPDLLVWDEDLTKRNRANCKHLLNHANKGLALLQSKEVQ